MSSLANGTPFVQIEVLAGAEASRQADARRAALYKRCLEDSVQQLRTLQARCSQAEARVQRDKQNFDAAMKRAEVYSVCIDLSNAHWRTTGSVEELLSHGRELSYQYATCVCASSRWRKNSRPRCCECVRSKVSALRHLRRSCLAHK